MAKDDDKYLDVDLNNLHFECKRQADLFHEHAKMRAQADKEVDHAKNLLKLATAKLDYEIRTEPIKFKLAKITDEVVKAAVIREPTYQRLAKAVIDKEYEAAVHAADVDALRQKKDMLEKLVQLRLADYFADPVLPRQEQEAVDHARKVDVRSRGQR